MEAAAAKFAFSASGTIWKSNVNGPTSSPLAVVPCAVNSTVSPTIPPRLSGSKGYPAIALADGIHGNPNNRVAGLRDGINRSENLREGIAVGAQADVERVSLGPASRV